MEMGQGEPDWQNERWGWWRECSPLFFRLSAERLILKTMCGDWWRRDEVRRWLSSVFSVIVLFFLSFMHYRSEGGHFSFLFIHFLPHACLNVSIALLSGTNQTHHCPLPFIVGYHWYQGNACKLTTGMAKVSDHTCRQVLNVVFPFFQCRHFLRSSEYLAAWFQGETTKKTIKKQKKTWLSMPLLSFSSLTIIYYFSVFGGPSGYFCLLFLCPQFSLSFPFVLHLPQIFSHSDVVRAAMWRSISTSHVCCIGTSSI